MQYVFHSMVRYDDWWIDIKSLSSIGSMSFLIDSGDSLTRADEGIYC